MHPFYYGDSVFFAAFSLAREAAAGKWDNFYFGVGPAFGHHPHTQSASQGQGCFLLCEPGGNMRTKRLIVFLISSIFALSAFSTPALTADIPAAQPDKALVIFYRNSSIKGKAIRFEINDSGKRSIGTLRSGTIIHEYLEPGEHTFMVRSPSVDGQDSITLNVEEGKAYYVKGEILWGWPAGRPKFTQKSESEALADLEKL